MNLDEIHDQQNHLSLPNPRIAWQKWLLGKIFEGKGWKAKAIEHYEKFLSLWKDADPCIAEVVDARQRVAGLKT